MIPLVKPYIPSAEILMPELQKILYSGYIAEGEAVYQFEDKFKKYVGNPFSLALHSGTDWRKCSGNNTLKCVKERRG